ncbi:hypothetical protein IGI04_007540 [Brassica rapa subsp. trilocularis]|uniref:TIR domain-containing protein n=1 Tax=Brassica rapa subsp. trilocularis TaxID=1813537 RepID=A0ABQ7NL87_BRACM|nr:hypothetical protein IGI04_007540 [Brassica rapa subsp. trilocularis]
MARTSVKTTVTEQARLSPFSRGSSHHDVFISSSCDGTRDTFVSHLSAALKRVNITVMEEDDKNKVPETRQYLPKKTRLGIERSKICVVVLSEDFASSKHSLTTLAEIIEWRHSKTGATVVPVFYGVDRSLVEQQIGKYGEAFSKHEASEPKDRVTEWRNALTEAASIKEGLHSNAESRGQHLPSHVKEKLDINRSITYNSQREESVFLEREDIESILLEASGLSFVVDPGAFQDMSNLRLLKIYSSDPERRPGLDLSMGLLYLPYELRLLHWENYALRTLPEEFDPDNLVELNMPYSQLEELWEESKNLNSLKTINLHHSEKLVDIQELRDAHYLQLVDLQGCTSLQIFPSLQLLNLSGCEKLKSFPEIPNRVENLQYLCLSGTAIEELHTSLSNMVCLKVLEVSKKVKPPFSLKDLKDLKVVER